LPRRRAEQLAKAGELSAIFVHCGNRCASVYSKNAKNNAQDF